MEKQIKCSNCGAEFSRNLTGCPYCGTMYYPGAEQRYMEKMEDIRQDYEDLTEVMDKVAAEEARHQRLFWMSVCAILLTILVIGFLIYEKKAVWGKDEKLREQFWWMYENTAIMEELYEQGEHDRVLEIIAEGYGRQCYSYQWKLHYFYEIYEAVALLEKAQELDSQGKALERDFMVNLLAKEVEAAFALEDDYTQKQREALEPLVATVQEDFYSRWPMSEQDVQELHDMLKQNYYVWITPEQSESFIEKWYGEE